MSQAGAALPRCQELAVLAQAEARACPSSRRPYVLAVAILASGMGFVDGTVVSVAMPAIRQALGAGFGQAQWIANAYMLLLSSLILIGGAAGDRFGQRTVFGIGVAVFTATSLGCALANSAEALIAWRALQGAGAAFMVPGSLALIAKNFPREERGKAIGVWAAAAGIAAALGPLLGGWLLGVMGPAAWRWLFAINLPLGAAVLITLRLKVPRDRPAGGGGAIDWGGAALVSGGLALLALGLTEAGEGRHPSWTLIAVATALGAAFLVGFVVWEAKVREPMMPLGLFNSLPFSGANGLTLLLYLALSGVLFYLPMTLIEAKGWSPSAAGAVFLPFTAVMAVLAGPVGGAIDRYGTKALLAAGPVIAGVAFLLLALAVQAGWFWLGVMPAMLVLGVGMGLAVPPLSAAVVLATDDDQAGTASGVNNAVARVASLLAVAGLGAVAGTVFAQGLDPNLIGDGFGASSGFDFNEVERGLRDAAMVRGFQAVALIAAALSFASAAVAWFTQPGAIKAEPAAGQLERP